MLVLQNNKIATARPFFELASVERHRPSSSETILPTTPHKDRIHLLAPPHLPTLVCTLDVALRSWAVPIPQVESQNSQSSYHHRMSLQSECFPFFEPHDE